MNGTSFWNYIAGAGSSSAPRRFVRRREALASEHRDQIARKLARMRLPAAHKAPGRENGRLRTCSAFAVLLGVLHTPVAEARELNFDEAPLYYEISFDIAAAYATRWMEDHFAGGQGRDDFPTQMVDDRITVWLHGGKHSPAATPHDKRLDLISDVMKNSLIAGAALSPLWKPAGHRLGAFMTVVHSQQIWFFFNRTLKYAVDRQRPKYHYTKDPTASDTSSFPSGHAGQAFVMAFATDHLLQLPTWGRASLYSAATLSAVLRVAADRHFFTDIVAGAGVGLLGASLAYVLFDYQGDEPARSERGVTYQISAQQLQLTWTY